MLDYYSTWKIEDNNPQMPSVIKDLRICSKSHMMGEAKPKITDSTAEVNAQFVLRNSISYF